MVPGFNDSDEEMGQIVDLLPALTSTSGMSAYFSAIACLLSRAPRVEERLLAAVAHGRQAGLRYMYTGNISGADTHNDTFCRGVDRDFASRVCSVNAVKRGRCPLQHQDCRPLC